ncbi:MAG: FRG domain-containing protein [Paludibacteraceae bacterium]|nr:FRG domain-containing protein [Paludibacteraceae bacterium]
MDRLKAEDCEICYRGVYDDSWLDRPSLFRGDRLSKEKDALEEIVRHYPDEFASAHTVDILTQMQHYECPTRMLDVTSNFLVALFFACGGWDKVRNPNALNQKCPGEVRIYKVKKDNVKSIDSETVTLISNIARLKDGDQFGQLAWICEKDWGVWQKDDDLKERNRKDVNRVVLVKTRLNNPRVRAQSGEFFLFGGLDGIERDYQEIRKRVLDLPEEYLTSKILIRANEKEEILSDLEKYCGISYSSLCPEKHDFIMTVMK